MNAAVGVVTNQAPIAYPAHFTDTILRVKLCLIFINHTLGKRCRDQGAYLFAGNLQINNL